MTDQATVYADDHREVSKQGEPTAGGATSTFVVREKGTERGLTALYFQSDTIGAIGVQGLTNEVCIAVVSERLREFQAGDFACDENAAALPLLAQALELLESRTVRRTAEGTEGTHAEGDQVGPADASEMQPEVLDADETEPE